MTQVGSRRYQATMQPTMKSDVYSFGVVLLELITGKPAILRDPRPISLIQWVQQRLAQGDIEGVVDVRMGGHHDVNSVWKSTEVALKCTAHTSAQRPTMTDVVAQLLECLELEGRPNGDVIESFNKGSSRDLNSGYHEKAYSDDVSQSSATSEVVAMMATGPDTR